jgi:acyl-CoA thioesterase
MPEHLPLNSKGFNPFGELIGLTFTILKNGLSQCVVDLSEKHRNPYGSIHGGVVYALVDTGMGAALYTLLKEREGCTTVEIKVTYFKAVLSGSLMCDTRVLHKGGHIAFLESEVRNGESLVAKATGTFAIFKLRK